MTEFQDYLKWLQTLFYRWGQRWVVKWLAQGLRASELELRSSNTFYLLLQTKVSGQCFILFLSAEGAGFIFKRSPEKGFAIIFHICIPKISLLQHLTEYLKIHPRNRLYNQIKPIQKRTRVHIADPFYLPSLLSLSPALGLWETATLSHKTKDVFRLCVDRYVEKH